jgi:hypothetical protein
MAEHAPPQEGQGDLLAEEDVADGGWNVGEGEAHAADDEVLEGGCALDEGGASVVGEEVALVEEGYREF